MRKHTTQKGKVQAPDFRAFMAATLVPVAIPDEVPEWQIGKFTASEWNQLPACAQEFVADAVEEALHDMWKSLDAHRGEGLPFREIVKHARAARAGEEGGGLTVADATRWWHALSDQERGFVYGRHKNGVH